MSLWLREPWHRNRISEVLRRRLQAMMEETTDESIVRLKLNAEASAFASRTRQQLIRKSSTIYLRGSQEVRTIR